MKYILIISAVFPPEPVVSAKLSYDIACAIRNLGQLVKVIHPEPTRPLGFKYESYSVGQLGEDEVTMESYTCPQSSIIGRIRESWSFGKACEKYIKEHRDDILCIYANTWPMFSQKAIVKVANQYNLPCIIHVQDVYPESLANKLPGILGGIVKLMLTPMDKYILRHCDKVVAISNKMKNYLVRTRNVEKEKISVVINWQDEKNFINYQNIETMSLFTFMYMGNIGPVAGVDLLIDAFAEADLKNARLVIAGSGSMKDTLRQRAQPYKNIEFWEVPDGKVPEIQAQADVMLLPIKKGAAGSSIPSKLPAYMFSAKPIIGCVDKDSDTSNAIEDSKGGWIVEPENVKSLADKMLEVSLLDRGKLKSFGGNALKYGIEHFSKSKNLPKLVDVILANTN